MCFKRRCYSLPVTKAIYASVGQEAPPACFPDDEQGHANKAANATAGANLNDRSVGVEDPPRGDDDDLPCMLSVHATVDKDNEKGEQVYQQRADDNDPSNSCSQEARSVAFPCGTGKGETARGLAPLADDLSDSVGNVEHTTVGGLLGTSPGDLEINCSENRHHVPLSSNGAGAGDGTGGSAVDRPLRTASTATTASGTARSSSLSSAATSVLMGRAPKLLDFFHSDDERSRSDFRNATDYIEKFREFDLDRAILEKGLGATGENLAALDLPLVARYTFQVISSRQHIILCPVFLGFKLCVLSLQPKQFYRNDFSCTFHRHVPSLHTAVQCTPHPLSFAPRLFCS